MYQDARLLAEFWKRYEKKMAGDDYLIEDGVNPDWFDVYNSQTQKVLFVLKETNDTDSDAKCRKSLFDNKNSKPGWIACYEQGERTNMKMLTKMLKMNFAVQNAENITVEGISKHFVKSEDVKKIAFININKHGNGGKKSDNRYVQYLDDDGALLCEQVQSLEPDIIVLGARSAEAKFRENVLDKLKGFEPKFIVTKHFSVNRYADFIEQLQYHH